MLNYFLLVKSAPFFSIKLIIQIITKGCAKSTLLEKLVGLIDYKL